jgi:hypothetical protein
MTFSKTQLLMALSIAFLVANANPIYAQFDLGGIIQGEARGVLQRLENEIRGELQNGLPQILPYDPNQYTPGTGELVPYPQPQHNFPNPAPVPANPGNSYPGQSQPGQLQLYPNNLLHYDRVPQPNIGPVLPSNPGTAPKPVSTKPTAKKLPKVESAGVINMSTREYGSTAGKVYLKIGKLVLNVETLNWTSKRVQAKLPYMPMQNSTEALVLVLSPENRLLDKAEIQLTPSSKPAPDVRATREMSAKPKIPTVSPGQRLNIKGELGEAKGSVVLKLEGMSIPAKILDWNSGKVSFDLPAVSVSKEQKGQVVVTRADGTQAKTVDVKLAASSK